MAALQPFQVIGQLHDALHQHRVGVVAMVDLGVDQRLGQLFHFLGHHSRAVQLDHAQRALHLVQQVRTGTQLARVLAFLDVTLQRVSRLPQRLVELGLDPGERGEIDIFVQPHAEVLSLRRRRNGRPCQAIAN